MKYSGTLSVQEARRLYFQNSGFDEQTYVDTWVKLPLLGFHIYLPNLKPRREAVPFHDIDHILTEYGTDWLGEWEIAAYEMGTGCGLHWIGWLINMQAILAGAIRTPRASIRAFARGRRSKGVFHFPSWQELLKMNLGELREQTTAPVRVDVGLMDILLLYLWVIFSLAIHLGIPALVLILALGG